MFLNKWRNRLKQFLICKCDAAAVHCSMLLYLWQMKLHWYAIDLLKKRACSSSHNSSVGRSTPRLTRWRRGEGRGYNCDEGQLFVTCEPSSLFPAHSSPPTFIPECSTFLLLLFFLALRIRRSVVSYWDCLHFPALLIGIRPFCAGPSFS